MSITVSYSVTLLCLFLCMEQLCKCFRKTNAENQCICDGPCFRRWGGGGCMGLEVEFRALTVWGKSC